VSINKHVRLGYKEAGFVVAAVGVAIARGMVKQPCILPPDSRLPQPQPHGAQGWDVWPPVTASVIAIQVAKSRNGLELHAGPSLLPDAIRYSQFSRQWQICCKVRRAKPRWRTVSDGVLAQERMDSNDSLLYDSASS